MVENIFSILKNNGIIAFNQSIYLKKILKVNNVTFKVELIINNFNKKFNIYRYKLNKPLITVININELQKKYPQIKNISKKQRSEEIHVIKNIIQELTQKEISFSTPNTYFFNSMGRDYIIDSSYTAERAKNLKKFLLKKHFDILCSHYHPDHWGNNGKLAKKDTTIFLHPKSIDVFGQGYYKFLYKHFINIIETFDIKDLFQRTFKIGKKFSKIIAFFVNNISSFVALLLVAITSKVSGITNLGKNYIIYLKENEKKIFKFGNVQFTGWAINDKLIALETPSHSYDQLSYYLKDKKAFFIGDSDVFLNPIGERDSTIQNVLENNKKMIKFVDNENIDILLPSHFMPIIGKKRILEYLRQYEFKTRCVYKDIKKIVLKKDEWEWRYLMEEIYKNPTPLIIEAIKKNWPKSQSNIDMYIYMMLRECSYKLVDKKRKIWEKTNIKSSFHLT